MRPSYPVLRPIDVPVLIYVAEHPDAPYEQLATVLGISTSTGHVARARLVESGLAHRVGRARVAAAKGSLLEFLQYAVQYVFPARVIPKARGIPTGLSAPVLLDLLHDPALAGESIDSAELYVWPSRLGTTIGIGVPPLVKDAPKVASLDPAIYRWLALIDVLRVGDVRARTFARHLLPTLVAKLP